MREPTIAAGIAQALLELAVSKGADPPELLARAGITRDDLDDRDNRIPLNRYLEMMRTGKELCRDPALALHFGEAVDCTKYSVVGLICGACETVADAFAQANRYSKLGVDFDVEDNRFGMEPEPGGFWIVDKRRNPNDSPEMTETWAARMITAIRRLSKDPIVKRVQVTHPAPAYRAEYDRIFGVPTEFGSARNAVLLDQSWLTYRLTTSSRYAFGLLTAHADALIASLETSTTTRGCVERLLMPILHTGDITMDAIASKMGLSRQTLRRKLKAEGVTFEKVLDALRHRLALDYLGGKKVSVNETAYLVGFSDPASFSRAFKRWTGMPPRTVRAAKAGAAGRANA